MPRVTLQTIADVVGVSRMTVSNAFSRPDQLSKELRARVLAAARELGYPGPDPAARALARGTTGAVGILLTDSLRYAFTDEVATGFLGAIADELAPTGLAITLLSSEDHGDVVPARDIAIDGAIVYSCRPQSIARDWLVRRNIPLVFVDQDPAPGIASINVDDRGGAKAAAEHLIELEHRNIAIVTLDERFDADSRSDEDGGREAGPQPYPLRQRMLGWMDALEAVGIEPRVVELPAHTDIDAATAAEALLGDADRRPTAVLCYSDVLAVGVASAAHRLGLDIPDQLSIVGFDDSPAARRHDPPLTTVHQDIHEKGRITAAALAVAITPGAVHDPENDQVTLPTELIVRGTTAPPARSR